jgi:hypothetical protein
MSPIRCSMALALAGLLLVPPAALAHNLIVTAEVLDQVRVHAYYDDKTDAEGAVVKVRDAEGREIATGKLDEKGVWSFPRPGAGTYTIRVESVGHGNEVVLPLADDPKSGRFSSLQPNVVVGAAAGIALLLGISLWYRYRIRANADAP